MRFSSASGEGWHRSVRTVREFRGCLVHNVCLRTSRRLKRSRQCQTVAIAFVSSGRDVRVCCRPSVGCSGSESRGRFSDSVACVYRLGQHSLANWSLWADEGCRRLDGALGVARPSLTDYQEAKAQYHRQCLAVGCVLEVEGAADDAPPVFLFFVLAWSGSGVKAPATDGQVTLGCHITWQPLQMWRRDATTVTVLMPDGAVKGNLLELTTWDKFERSLVRWRNIVVSARLVAGICNTKSEQFRHRRWEVPSAR